MENSNLVKAIHAVQSAKYSLQQGLNPSLNTGIPGIQGIDGSGEILHGRQELKFYVDQLIGATENYLTYVRTEGICLLFAKDVLLANFAGVDMTLRHISALAHNHAVDLTNKPPHAYEGAIGKVGMPGPRGHSPNSEVILAEEIERLIELKERTKKTLEALYILYP